MRSEHDEIKQILEFHNITDVDQIGYGDECYDDLYDFYANSGEMPYGVMKARTGMPDEWIYEKLCDLGFDKIETHDPNGLPLNFTDKYHEEEIA